VEKGGKERKSQCNGGGGVTREKRVEGAPVVDAQEKKTGKNSRIRKTGSCDLEVKRKVGGSKSE